MKIAKRMQRLGTENAFTVLAKVNKLRAEGHDIISFSIGEPDFDTPRNIIDKCHEALDKGMTHYTGSQGLPDFRKAVAEYISRTRGISVVPEEVVAVPGGKPIIFHSIMACVDEGDEVLYPNPGYPIYESVINFVGAKAVPVPILEEKDFSLDVDNLEKLITPKTTFMIINSPQNPTGGSIPKADLQKIAQLCIKHDITVLSDEIYSRLIFNGEHNSIASVPGMKERTIILDGMSKTYAMTGWRLGYGVMPVKIAEAVTQLVTNDESCTATFTQAAGIEALLGSQAGADEMKAVFAKRRELIVNELRKVPGFKCHMPSGAFYVFPNVTEACRMAKCKDSRELVDRLLLEAGVSVLPRTSFGVKNVGEKEEYIRLSYATSTENIMNGVARIRDFMKSLV